MSQTENIELLGRRAPLVDPKTGKGSIAEQTTFPPLLVRSVGKVFETLNQVSRSVAITSIALAVAFAAMAATKHQLDQMTNQALVNGHGGDPTTVTPPPDRIDLTQLSSSNNSGDGNNDGCLTSGGLYVHKGNPAPISGWICGSNGQFYPPK